MAQPWGPTQLSANRRNLPDGVMTRKAQEVCQLQYKHVQKYTTIDQACRADLIPAHAEHTEEGLAHQMPLQQDDNGMIVTLKNASIAD